MDLVEDPDMTVLGAGDEMPVVLTNHARQRAAEMGVLTKRVKRVVREPELRYPRKSTKTMMAVADDLAIPYCVSDGRYVVITVLWRSHEQEFTR